MTSPAWRRRAKGANRAIGGVFELIDQAQIADQHFRPCIRCLQVRPNNQQQSRGQGPRGQPAQDASACRRLVFSFSTSSPISSSEIMNGGAKST